MSPTHFYIPEPPDSPERTDGVELEAGCYYMSREGRKAKICETGVTGHPEGRSCVGYWITTGLEDQWLPDGGVDDIEFEDDLIKKITEEEAFATYGNLKPGSYYWTKDGKRIAKIYAENIRRFHDNAIINSFPCYGEDPCLGYWLDNAEVNSWSPSGSCLFNDEVVCNRDLDTYREVSQSDVVAYLNSLKPSADET